MQKKHLSESEALNRLASLCARTEYCVQDMRRKLAVWELPEGAEARIIKRLTEDKYIDENRYAHAFVRSKFRFNRWGREKIRLAMRQKGLDDSTINDALAELDGEEENATLLELLKAKNRQVSAKSDYERYVKLLRFAVSRGFSIDNAKEAFQKMKDSNS